MNPDNTEEKEMKVYEVAFNLVPFLEESALAQEFGNLKDELSKAGAITISEQYPKPIDLAYEMTKVIDNKKQKFRTAFFGWIKFDMAAGVLAEFENKLKRNSTVIRYLIIKTARENTMSLKKTFGQGREGYRRKTEGVGEAGPEVAVDKEAIDQKIEELVV